MFIIKVPNPHNILMYNLQTLDKAATRKVEAGRETSPILWRNPFSFG
jgi:hypothetical protein